MTENNKTKMQEYGYYEVYVPVWNPKTQDRPVNMTIDIYGDENLLDDMGIGRAVREYGSGDIQNTRECERIIGNSLYCLIEEDLIMDVYCDDFGISSIEDLENMLDKDCFEAFPL